MHNEIIIDPETGIVFSNDSTDCSNACNRDQDIDGCLYPKHGKKEETKKKPCKECTVFTVMIAYFTHDWIGDTGTKDTGDGDVFWEEQKKDYCS